MRTSRKPAPTHDGSVEHFAATRAERHPDRDSEAGRTRITKHTSTGLGSGDHHRAQPVAKDTDLDDALDPRLRAVLVLLAPAFLGHAVQLAAEDARADAWERYWTTPGWHLWLPPAMPLGIGVLLAVAVLAMSLSALRDAPRRRTRDARVGVALGAPRAWLVVVTLLFIAHYVTFPFRIRNHMGHLLALLGGASLALAVLRLSRERVPPRPMDALVLQSIVLMTCVTYAFAGLHKLNAAFLDVDLHDASGPLSAGARAVAVVWRRVGLDGPPPTTLQHLAVWGTVALELFAPLLAWRAPRVRVVAIASLLAFHALTILAMPAADYALIVCAGLPAFVSRAEALRLAPQLRPSRANALGAALGVLAQATLGPARSSISSMSMLGALALGLIGWCGAALARDAWGAWNARSVTA